MTTILDQMSDGKEKIPCGHPKNVAPLMRYSTVKVIEGRPGKLRAFKVNGNEYVHIGWTKANGEPDGYFLRQDTVKLFGHGPKPKTKMEHLRHHVGHGLMMQYPVKDIAAFCWRWFRRDR